MGMFCNQCEQATKGLGCDVMGNCGKDPQVAALQDVLTHQIKGLGFLNHFALSKGIHIDEVNPFIIEGLFITVTNVNFDPDRIVDWIQTAAELRNRLMERLKTVDGFEKLALPPSVTYSPHHTIKELVVDANRIETIGLFKNSTNEDIRSLKQLLLYGLRGMAAYAEHARILGKTDAQIFSFTSKALAELNRDDIMLEELVELCMECGTVNLRTMEILDDAHVSRFGHPEPTEVSTALKPGPAIVVSGHDLLDLEELLRQTADKGVNVYTHGEMLPAHGYPELKKYSHLAGHFGTAWQNQREEFEQINAAFLFTTNCIQNPKESYKNNVFTTGLVGWPGVEHVTNHDFTPVIERAIELGGLEKTEGQTLLTGFARNTVMSVADQVIEAVKDGSIRHFFLVGGCDGAKPGRNYYTEFVEKTPEDTVVLTLACGKFRFNHLNLGDIGGIPRLLDIGQCNDAYSAIKIAVALSDAFNCSVNDLPLSMILSWYEQKAVAILLTLLSLGIKGIRLGPTLPAFISPNILKFLVENFDVKPIGTAEEDLKAILEPSEMMV